MNGRLRISLTLSIVLQLSIGCAPLSRPDTTADSAAPQRAQSARSESPSEASNPPPETTTDATGTASEETNPSANAANDEQPRASDEEEEKASAKAEARRRRRTVLLKTVYDDQDVGEDQSELVASEMGFYADEDLERYVQSVAVRLLRYAPNRPFDYEFRIVDQLAPNAFALPGGKIFVSRGLLALVGSEDELAAVLGHEITHSAERHAAARVEHARRLNPLTLGFLRAAKIAAYGREHERDADRGGQILCAKAGYDPIGIATFLRKLDAAERYEVGWSRLPNFFATHPTSPERSALAAQRASDLEWTPAEPVASDYARDFHAVLDGLILGEDPAGGLVKDGRFVHPDLGFSLRFPPSWEVLNSPQAVAAVSPDRDAEATLSLGGSIAEEGDTLESIVDELLDNTDPEAPEIRVLDRRALRFGELDGIRVIARAGGLHLEMAFIQHDDLVFQLAFKTPNGGQSKYRGRANAFIKSFRPLDEEGVYSLQVTRLRTARARDKETLAELSARTRNDLELGYTGVLNDLFPNSILTKGQPIKIGLKEPYFPKPPEESPAPGQNDRDALQSEDEPVK